MPKEKKQKTKKKKAVQQSPKKIESEGETLFVSENMEDLDLSSLVEEDDDDELDDDSYPDLGNDVLNDDLSKIDVVFATSLSFSDPTVEISGLLSKTNGISHTSIPNGQRYKFKTELMVWFSVQNMIHFSTVCTSGVRVKYVYLTYKSEWSNLGHLIEFKILGFEDGMVLCKILFNSVNT